MERFLILLAGVIVLLMLVYASLMQHHDEAAQLADLNSVQTNDDWFRERVLENPKTVLVDFTATWCGPCRQLKPLLEELQKEYADRLEVVAVDGDERHSLVDAYHVEGYPTLMVVRQGKVVAFAAGAGGYGYLEALVKPHLGEAAAAAPAN